MVVPDNKNGRDNRDAEVDRAIDRSNNFKDAGDGNHANAGGNQGNEGNHAGNNNNNKDDDNYIDDQLLGNHDDAEDGEDDMEPEKPGQGAGVARPDEHRLSEERPNFVDGWL